MDILKDNAQVSNGFKALVDGYGKYAADVAVNRAIPAIDGLKPVHRRILYTMHKHKITSLCKSANVCGKVLEFHPHSDASVYATALLMVDSSEYNQFSFIHGKGNFSKVYFSEKDSQAAASRYTEMCLSDNAETLFGEMDGVQFQDTEDGATKEPILLPTSFPNILCTAQMGIAVGIACTIPSFNFNEVNDLTIEYLKTGQITRAIAPDFNTGGELVFNANSIKSIMLTGRGNIKLRGTWQKEGKEILITQIPYYSRISDILAKARTINGVVTANDETDLHGMKIRITCSSKAIVDTVILELLRDTGLQYSTGVNMAVVTDGAPVFTGVIGFIQKWCDFRREVLKKQYTLTLESVRHEMKAPKALITLISNTTLRDLFLEALKVSADAAIKVLKDNIPDIDRETIDYILDLKIRQFADCEGRKRQFNMLVKKEQDLVAALADLDAVIIRQLKALNAKYQIPRKTKLVTNDYSFESINEAKQAAKQVASYAVSIEIHDNFIKKMRLNANKTEKTIECMSDNIIICLDNKGRLLRIPLSEVADCSADALGAYIPKVLGIDADFEIIDYALLQPDKKLYYLYNDGYVATLDMSEWKDMKRVTKVTDNGLAPKYIDKLMTRIGDNKEMPYLLCFTNKEKVGIFTTDISLERSRQGRSKHILIDKDDTIKAVIPISVSESMLIITGDDSKYHKRCCALSKKNTLNADVWSQIQARIK